MAACASSSRTSARRSTAAASPVKRVLGDEVDRRGRLLRRRPRRGRLQPAVAPAGAAGWRSVRMTAARQRPLARELRRRRARHAGSTRCAPGSTRSCRGGTISARRVDVDDLRVAALTGATLIEQAAQRAGPGSDAALLQAWAQDLQRAAQGGGAAAELQRARHGRGARRGRRAPPGPAPCADLRPRAAADGRARARALLQLVRVLPALGLAPSPARHGTFADCEAWLPYVAAHGLRRAVLPADPPDRPHQPQGPQQHAGRRRRRTWAARGRSAPTRAGTTRSCRELGTLDDFRRLVQRAGEHGIEIALDIAFQCAPDHPWVREHPQWFRQRADGSIQYAENPPKKYQDIYPFDFESDDWRGAVAGAGRRVRVLDRAGRADLPRRQPAHQVLRASGNGRSRAVRARHPEVIFLSEAFTRPKVMHRLAKLGFSQSYTYFTWRNTKQELTDYFTELAQRPGPRVLPAQRLAEHARHPARRAAVRRPRRCSWRGWRWRPRWPPTTASTARPSSCSRRRALRAGGEEYLDSEKYEQRVWDRDDPASLAAFIALLNQTRRDNPALQQRRGPALHRHRQRAADRLRQVVARRLERRRLRGQPRPAPCAERLARARPAGARAASRSRPTRCTTC